MHAINKVVLVEDDGSVRQALERVLRGAGYDVEAFESAESMQDSSPAVPLAECCDCVVCDVRLPGLSGFELHRRLADRGALPPWIFITAHDDPTVRRQAQRDGAACLLKPFLGNALLSLLEQMLVKERK